MKLHAIVSKLPLITCLVAVAASTPTMAQDHDAVRVKSRATALSFETLTPFEHPWAIEVLPDGGVLMTKKPGRLRMWRNGALSAPIGGVPKVFFSGQGGLLDVALNPNFAQNRMIYLAYTEAADDQSGGRDVSDQRLGVFQDLEDGVVKGLAVGRAVLGTDRLEDFKVIWRAEKTAGRGHFGGRLAFSPDGFLLISSGDRQRFEPAQDLKSNLGKIIRVRPEDGSALPDNPFAGGPDAEHDVFSYGHRNPLGMAVRPGTDEIWVAEMGPQNGDELNLVLKGRNYGWPLVSAGDNYNATPLARPRTQPSFEAARERFPVAISPASLMFYEGPIFPAWKGDILVGALNKPGIVRGIPGPDGVHDIEHIETGFRVRDMAQAPDGSILVLRCGTAKAVHFYAWYRASNKTEI